LTPTGFITSPVFLDHETGSLHPESPERLKSITARLEKSKITEHLIFIEPRQAHREELELVHSRGYIDSIKSKCENNVTVLDGGDTVVSHSSYSVALQAAGGVVRAVEMIFSGEISNAFCSIRPPGHHAEVDTAMGFCLFNNAAVAAKMIQKTQGAERVLILDWDVHHGNGTQHIFESDPTVHYISLHQHPFYPGTGTSDETGKGDGLGTTTNFSLSAGSGDEVYRDIFNNVLPDIVVAFKPDFIILSAGFDAHIRDPLANMNVSTECFTEMTGVMSALASELCVDRLLSLLEGGYDLKGLADSVEAHLEKLTEAVPRA